VTQAYFSPNNLTVDKASQTPEEWCNLMTSDKKKTSRRSASVGSGDCLKEFKARLAKTTKDAGAAGATGRTGGSARRSPICVVHNDLSPVTAATLPMKPVPIPLLIPSLSSQRMSSHSSLEGLNQEIEGLVLNTTSTGSHLKSPSDGRRAPIAREFKSCASALTQTPPVFLLNGEPSEQLHTRAVDGTNTVDFGSRDDISKVSSSPELASFISERLPPDGCEKVIIKFLENNGIKAASAVAADASDVGDDLKTTTRPLFVKLPAPAVFHIPSEKSAFFVPSSMQRSRDVVAQQQQHPAPMSLLCKYTGNSAVMTAPLCVVTEDNQL
jgi:hypothetical protein